MIVTSLLSLIFAPLWNDLFSLLHKIQAIQALSVLIFIVPGSKNTKEKPALEHETCLKLRNCCSPSFCQSVSIEHVNKECLDMELDVTKHMGRAVLRIHSLQWACKKGFLNHELDIEVTELQAHVSKADENVGAQFKGDCQSRGIKDSGFVNEYPGSSELDADAKDP